MKAERIEMKDMTIEEKLSIVKQLQDNKLYHPGSFIHVKYQSVKPTLKGYSKVNGEQEVLKVTEATIRLDILYSNTQKFIAQNRELQPLASQYDHHLKGYEKLLIETIRPNEETRYKLICYKTNNKSETKWYLNGQETEKDNLKGIISSTEWTPSKVDNDYFTVKLENVLAIEL